MFFFDEGKKEQMRRFAAQVELEIRRLEAGEDAGLRGAYCAFAMKDAKLKKHAGEAVRNRLASMDRSRLLKLCERFRTFTSLEWSIDWKNVSIKQMQKELPEEVYRYALILGSFHPNGYFREQCVYAMGAQKEFAFWLFPRVNDWVREVREAAVKTLLLSLPVCGGTELLCCLPAYERLLSCRRRTEPQMKAIEEQMEAGLSRAMKEVESSQLFCLEQEVRRALYRQNGRFRFLSLSKLHDCLMMERENCSKQMLIKRILEHPDCTIDWAEQYLADPSAQVRKAAVEFRYERTKASWPGLERMLLDKSRGVREYAAYILELRSHFDIRGYYLSHLKDEQPSCAILGLSEYQSRGNVRAFLDCLERSERKILKCTLLALGSQEDFSDEELLWNYLLDDRIEVSKAACLSIRKKGFRPGAGRIFAAYRNAKMEHQRRYLLKLLLRESPWSRLPGLLRLYRRDLPEQEKYQVLSGIRSRTMYGKLPGSLQEEIVSALEESREELPDGLEAEILYDMKFLI